VGVAIAMPVAAGGADASAAGMIMVLVVLAGLFVWLWLAIKLSAASALTIRDRKIKFSDSWGATRGRFWALLGAYLTLAIVALIVYFVILGIILTVMLGTSFSFGDPSAITAMTNPQTFGAMFFVFFLILSMIQALFLYIWAGPAALAAKTDPRGGGMPDVAEEFT
jgi:hypothetical protein